MNHFTREELREMLSVDYCETVSFELHNKIKKLLKEYCEHVDVGECAECGVLECLNCNQIIGRGHCGHE